MSRYINPVTDRTAEDVKNKTVKAFFNVAVWVRIYKNSQVVKTLVDFILSTDTPFDSITTPTIYSVPTIAQLNALLSNIESIRQAEGLPTIAGIDEAIKCDWQEGVGSQAPDYLDANQWEAVLDEIYNSIGSGLDYRIYAGVCNAGQPRFFQARFHVYSWVTNAVSPVRRARAGVSVAGSNLIWNNGFRRYI